MSPYDNIPEPLARKPNWVVWGVPGEPQKSPFQPDSLMKLKTVPAISGNPATWGRFETAARCVEMGIAQGIGYEFDGGGVYGVDLDHVRSDNGKVTPEAQAIVKQLASYAEISPSGHGLHIFVTADDADITHHRRKGGFIEIYSAGRYFTVTGNVYGEHRNIESRSAELQQIHDRYLLPERARVSKIQQSTMSAVSVSDSLSVGLQRDPVLRACYYGAQRFGDESGSDQALMNKLAYWLSADQDAMVRAFLSSPYHAQKDEAHKRKCQRCDYLPNTAKAACATLRSTAFEDSQRYRQSRINRESR